MAFTANTHSLFSRLSFGGIVLLTHSSGFLFSFCAFVLFSDQLSRQGEMISGFSAWHSSSESWEEFSPSSGTHPVLKNLSDWPYLGHFLFLCQSLGKGNRVLKLGWSFVLFLEMEPQLCSFIRSCSRWHWQCPHLMPVLLQSSLTFVPNHWWEILCWYPVNST